VAIGERTQHHLVALIPGGGLFDVAMSALSALLVLTAMA
jgi:hypothetical protein